MNLTSNPIRLGIPTLIILGLVAVIAFMAWGTGGSAGGLGATSMLRGTVEYTVFDANGNIKDHGINHNAVSAKFLESARDVLGLDFDKNGASDTALYDAIELCAFDASGTTITAAACTGLSGNLSTDNPQNGTVGADAVAFEANAFKVTLTFTATNASVIEGFHLCGKQTQTDNTPCTASDIGAFQNTGTINLANTDTIQIVWTITFAAA